MKYNNITKGVFISRPNRFIAQVEIEKSLHTVHVKNTGRCKELLKRGVAVYLSKSDNPARKTEYDLISVEKQRPPKGDLLINMDSQIPNDVVYEWLPQSGIFSSSALIKREVFFENSRFDIFVSDGDRKAFVEVKGVTLEENGVAMFPDAPTQRGVKHLMELCSAKEKGYEAYVIFVIQMKGIHLFKPNRLTHPQFADALKTATEKGVKPLAVDCMVTPDTIQIDSYVDMEI